MTNRYLEITYRQGKPFAAYLYLARRPGDVSARTDRHENGLIVDFAEDGRPIGIELTAPTRVRLDSLNQLLASLGFDPLDDRELAPLAAA